MIYGLKHGIYDLVLSRDTLLGAPGFKTWPLASDRLAALVCQNHPLAGASAISLKSLSDENFILMRRQSSIYQLSIDSCMAQGFTPHVIRTARIESILSAVASGEGVSLLCRKNFTVFNPDGIAVLEIEPKIETSVYLAYMEKQNLSKAARVFWKYITQTALL